MVNKIWISLFLIGIIYGLLSGNAQELNNTILQAPIDAMNLMIKLSALLVLWSGILQVLQDCGVIDKLSKKISFITKRIFPELPKEHRVHGYIATNIIANVLGLGSAATPFGLKAMKEMRKINDDKPEASNSMITMLLLNTSGLTLIPTTIISMRYIYGSVDPTRVVPCIVVATSFSTTFALVLDRFIRKRLLRRDKNVHD